MSKHTLKKGQDLIEALTYLGIALGYAVAQEMPIQKCKKSPEAIDLAWLLEDDQEFPLMIFEVESKTGNTIANNPSKVFAKTNVQFEKPLFYFHVIISYSKESTKLEDLRSLFGKHNYRTYEIEKRGEITVLVKDILSQHRRITRKIDLQRLHWEFQSGRWEDLDKTDILMCIETLGFEKGNGHILPEYASLASFDPSYKEHFKRYLSLRDQYGSLQREHDQYQTYFGAEWSYPIHLAILANAATPDNRKRYFERLKNWQEGSFFPTQIGPHFGLSRDYDIFILGQAGYFWTIIAALMSDIDIAVRYISDQYLSILRSIEDYPIKISFYTALWLLHISTLSAKTQDNFEIARNFINSRGGAAENTLYHPPGIIDVEENNDDWLSPSNRDQVTVPDFASFLTSTEFSNDIDEDPTSLALKTLSDVTAPLTCSNPLADIINFIAKKKSEQATPVDR